MRKQQRRTKDLVGKTFGRLFVIGYESGIGRKVTGKYVCLCSCGETTKVISRSLSSGETQSCGCLQKERASRANSLRPFESLYNHFLRTAKHQGWRTEITYSNFLEYTKEKLCHYCFSKVAWSLLDKEGNPWCYNLDRKDSSVGYSRDNVVVCCKKCNRGKSDLFTYEEWWRMTECFRKEASLGIR